MINQAATKLFFRQSEADANKVAEMIDVKRKGKWATESIRFKVGQAVAVGTLECRGRIIDQPVVTYSAYQKREQGLIVK